MSTSNYPMIIQIVDFKSKYYDKLYRVYDAAHLPMRVEFKILVRGPRAEGYDNDPKVRQARRDY